ncbi:hypothetical protein [Vibrio natriegens]|uniref:Uncharacterized protein n=1 Tax=Vibrio natriegens NBRC 15636 = ATCC 14048 = DSM 759 TaxID=1219067 RepID=A0AAN1CY87_VIBNA|nr:hypothetical protein [Vibrio natriegens]ALR18618.1 hypothetical protein PN96_22240 [Vibrio natriegens NBRC 15636 = ATCC 14048 = DSM 759]ANQ14585.1 hypothetical protein BA890_17735 [Vibrio natriegens NBRC 15636 = ATCC 14048 = DSM 759]EPM39620.1 hypothetical protein M272_15480 [Vibrio natriegens NBRC 15636 = ATCC 14048 = DSM 759]MDX6028454.1 hypothetical protein [Vibrio natriegens NBRC 15636 = ATCC 14048 = DSM 759]UUI14822.1 hypothetical protein NP431_19515 [Vibrio natriegens]
MIETAVLLEYSIKKDVSKVLVEQEKFLHVRAFDSNDRKEIEDGAAEEYMRANQMEPVEVVAVYDVIFPLPTDSTTPPTMLRISSSYKVLNNKWAVLN